MENGTVASMTKPKHIRPTVSGVRRNQREVLSEARREHRGEADEGADLREVEDAERGDLILRAQQENRGEGEQADVAPVAGPGGRRRAYASRRRPGAPAKDSGGPEVNPPPKASCSFIVIAIRGAS